MSDDTNSTFDPTNVDLTSADPTAVICYLNLSQNEYNGQLGARISALFVILVVSTGVTFFPVIAAKVPKLKIPTYVYLFARYFGAGVIIATAFVHLMDPAYGEIGPQTCVGMTGGWASYSWVAGLILTSVLLVFLLDFAAERYVEIKYGQALGQPDVEGLITENSQVLRPQGQDGVQQVAESTGNSDNKGNGKEGADKLYDSDATDNPILLAAVERSFRQQIAAFLILEFGVIFHSVIIGLKLGTAGPEFSTLYPVIVFHQSFEGLGIGARLSAIPIPQRLNWLAWFLCLSYGVTTPIAIAIGLGLRTTYNSGSFTASIVAGVLDSISAGILIYTGLVELLARDFLFNPERTKDNKRLIFMVTNVFIGALLMALLGKWA